jgi:hypothetical protein
MALRLIADAHQQTLHADVFVQRIPKTVGAGLAISHPPKSTTGVSHCLKLHQVVSVA